MVLGTETVTDATQPVLRHYESPYYIIEFLYRNAKTLDFRSYSYILIVEAKVPANHYIH